MPICRAERLVATPGEIIIRTGMDVPMVWKDSMRLRQQSTKGGLENRQVAVALPPA